MEEAVRLGNQSEGAGRNSAIQKRKWDELRERKRDEEIFDGNNEEEEEEGKQADSATEEYEKMRCAARVQWREFD